MFLGIVGTSAALANAIYHATGQRLRDLQLRIDSLITGLRTRRYGKRAQQSAIPGHLGASGLVRLNRVLTFAPYNPGHGSRCV
jgi:hypothetical protein